MDPIQSNKTFIEEAVNSAEFTEKIEEAAPYRVKIDVDYRREMKEVKDLFVKEMSKSDAKLTAIFAKDKKRREEDEVEYMKTAFKKASKEFQAVKKIIHPNKDGPVEAAQRLVDKVIEVAKMLKYIGKDYITNAFSAAGIKIEIPNLEDENEYFAKEGKKEIIADIFDQADEVQGQICQASDEIKIRIFDELPDNVRFDKDSNKNGIKKGAFQKIVKAKAVKLEKSSEKATKFKEYQIKDAEAKIIAKQIEAEKTKMV